MADSQVKTPNVMTSASAQVQRANGIKISCDGNGRYTINGTATADSTIYFDIPEFITPKSAQQGGNGTFRFFNPIIGSNSGDSRIYFYAGTTAVENYQLTIADRQSTTYGGSLAFQRINKISFFIRSGVTVANAVVTPMFTDDGTIPIIYQPYSATGWLHSLRKLGTATETIHSGDTIYANGQPISTYSIKGNTVQSGTPTQSNPVDVNGVGERTANLLNNNPATQGDGYVNGAILQQNGTLNTFATSFWVTEYIPITEGTYYYYNDLHRASSSYINFYDNAKTNIGSVLQKPAMTQESFNLTTLVLPTGTAYIRMNIDKQSTLNCLYDEQLSSYIPYGYKIPISCGGSTTNIYTAEPLMNISDYADSKSNTTETRAIRKCVITGQENVDYTLYSGKNMFTVYNAFDTTQDLSKTGVCSHYIFQWLNAYGYTYIANSCDKIYIFDENYDNASDFKAYLQQQYANGTPVTVYYILATPTTETVTAPSIPTTEGANSITVDTTVQPSEFTATWTGWHNASVKEKSENLFDISTVIEGMYIRAGNVTASNPLGQEVSNTTYNCTDYAPVKPNTEYTVHYPYYSSVAGAGLVYYTSNTIESAISGDSLAVQGGATYTFTTPNNCAYIRYSWQNAYGNEVTLNEGGSALPFEPYWK